MKTSLRFFFFLSLSSFLFACNSQVEQYPELEGEFIPLEVGKYIIYDVDSMIWDNFSKTYTVKKSEMKYEITDTFTSDGGQLHYVVTITRKDDSTDFFVDDNVATISVSNRQVEWVQKNLRYLNMVFPIEDGIKWDGLLFINREDDHYPQFASIDWEFEYEKVGKDFKSGSTKFDNTITIKHIDSEINEPDKEFYAEKILSKEVYADGIGMIYKEYIYWTYQPLEKYRIGNGVKMTFKSSNWK